MTGHMQAREALGQALARDLGKARDVPEDLAALAGAVTAPGAASLPLSDLLAAWMVLRAPVMKVSASRGPFHARPEAMEVLRSLQAAGLCHIRPPFAVWDDTAAPAMQAAGLWDRQGRYPADGSAAMVARTEFFNEIKADALMDDMPEEVREAIRQALRDGGKLEGLTAMAAHYRRGKWRTIARPPRGSGAGEDIIPRDVANILMRRLEGRV